MRDNITFSDSALTSAPDSTTVSHPDSLAIGETKSGIILEVPNQGSDNYAPRPSESRSSAFGMSWVYLIMAALFCVTALKFKGSVRYLQALLDDITDVRIRHNAFDDTVKETSLIILLNIVWTACAGIMLWIWVSSSLQGGAAGSVGLKVNGPEGIALCSAVALGYLCLMFLAYWVVGNVFSDAKLTSLWMKGAAASTGLQAFVLFPLAIISLNYPGWSTSFLIAAMIVFVLGKILFLYKGFRIFFTQISSWLLFLYYLCSLEIIPVIITFFATVKVCTA